MSSLKNVSDDELQAEIVRRAQDKAKQAVPKPLENIDWVPLTNYLHHGVQSVADGDGTPKDFEHWIFETAMETVYGPDIWKWWNKHQ
jgi:hypothetical protein